jgi:hypothetical protein
MNLTKKENEMEGFLIFIGLIILAGKISSSVESICKELNRIGSAIFANKKAPPK